MGCFIKKIFENKIDEKVHSQFVRFGKGSYKSRAIINLMKTDSIKIKSSFEYANDFVSLVAGLENVKFSGIILSKKEISGLEGKKKKGIYEYNFEGISEDVKKIENIIYYMLLDGESSDLKLKIKKKLPKPGKGEGKVDDKFCSLEADLKYWGKIKEYFFWDVGDCKKANIIHTYEINELVMPESQELKIPDDHQNSKRILRNEKDFEKIRILTKRKGKIIRKIIIDKEKESVKEAELEA